MVITLKRKERKLHVHVHVSLPWDPDSDPSSPCRTYTLPVLPVVDCPKDQDIKSGQPERLAHLAVGRKIVRQSFAYRMPDELLSW